MNSTISVPQYFPRASEPIPEWAEELFKDDSEVEIIRQEAEDERIEQARVAEIARHDRLTRGDTAATPGSLLFIQQPGQVAPR